jgi:hypothetical protein
MKYTIILRDGVLYLDAPSFYSAVKKAQDLYPDSGEEILEIIEGNAHNYLEWALADNKTREVLEVLNRDGQLEFIENPKVHGFHYPAYCSLGDREGRFSEASDGTPVFYSSTSYGDGGYDVYQHLPSGAILIDCGNFFSSEFNFDQFVVEDPELGHMDIKDLKTVLVGEGKTLESKEGFVITDPCYLDS